MTKHTGFPVLAGITQRLYRGQGLAYFDSHSKAVLIDNYVAIIRRCVPGVNQKITLGELPNSMLQMQWGRHILHCTGSPINHVPPGASCLVPVLCRLSLRRRLTAHPAASAAAFSPTGALCPAVRFSPQTGQTHYGHPLSDANAHLDGRRHP